MGECLWGCFDSCVGVLVKCVLVFIVFCIVLLCCFIVSFTYIFSDLFYMYHFKD